MSIMGLRSIIKVAELKKQNIRKSRLMQGAFTLWWSTVASCLMADDPLIKVPHILRATTELCPFMIILL